MSRACPHDPGLATAAELAALTAGRGVQLQLLHEELVAQAGAATRQHFLLLGESGSGKSHLALMLAHRLQDTQGWLWLRLADPGAWTGLSGLLAQISGRSGLAPTAWDAAPPPAELSLDRLRQRAGPPLLVIIEDLPEVLRKKLSRPEVQRLRAVLMHDPPFTLLATARRYSRELAHADEPLYDFFRSLPLPGLSVEEAELLLRRRAAVEGHTPGWPAAAVGALSLLAGRLPGQLQQIYAALRGAETPEAQLRLLLDGLGPACRSRLASLSPQQTRFLGCLARAPGPQPAARLGAALGVATNHTTAVLRVLLDEGLVERTSAAGKRSAYQLRPRWLRLWLTARADPAARERAGQLLRFWLVAAGAAPETTMPLAGLWQERARGRRWLTDKLAAHQPLPAPWDLLQAWSGADDPAQLPLAWHPEDQEAFALLQKHLPA